jgi:hypothetical protein
MFFLHLHLSYHFLMVPILMYFFISLIGDQLIIQIRFSYNTIILLVNFKMLFYQLQYRIICPRILFFVHIENQAKVTRKYLLSNLYLSFTFYKMSFILFTLHLFSFRFCIGLSLFVIYH